MQSLKLKLQIFALLLSLTASSMLTAQSFKNKVFFNDNSSNFEGAVYAMSNKLDGNTLVGYGRNDDGTLDFIGEFATGGKGGTFDGGEGLDPLISAYAVVLTDDKRFVLSVNAGSNSVSVMRINDDFSLTLTDQRKVVGVGPNSIAVRRGLVVVSSIDADGEFAGEPDQEGALTTFRLTRSGRLIPLRFSNRLLGNRPSAVQFSPDGRFLVVSSINAGSSALASDSQDELVVYRVFGRIKLSRKPVGRATSTLRGNAENRNLPSAIGFEIVRDGRRQYVVVTEAREFQADGAPPAFPALQTGSVSTWELTRRGRLKPINLDIRAGDGLFDGERTACWIEFSEDEGTFWVSNALDSSISSFSFDRGRIKLIEKLAAVGQRPDNTTPQDAFATTDGWIDLWISDDGKYLYQLFGLDGTIGVFEIEDDGRGSGLTLIQEVSDLPVRDTQGIVAL